jgi:predicted GIY-YIG superfamily endonuclease
MKGGWLYFMTNRRDGILYAGVTSNLPSRAFQHREGVIKGFTKRYGLKRLVYYEYLMISATRFSARKRSSTGRGRGKFDSSIR